MWVSDSEYYIAYGDLNTQYWTLRLRVHCLANHAIEYLTQKMRESTKSPQDIM